MTVRPIVLAGAAGFLGSRIAQTTLDRGLTLRAVVRRDVAGEAPWAARAELHRLDLSETPEGDADLALDALLEGAEAVIHAAAAFTGDDRTQARDTVAPTRRLLAALARRRAQAGTAPRLVLVSSLAVYGYAALPDGAQLDETTPLEPSPERRDAYCRGKLAQEALALSAAQEEGLEIRVVRPGAIVALDRLSTARLGLSLGGRLATIGPDAALPTVDVDFCARTILAAALTPVARHEAGPEAGPFEAINLIDPDPPLRSAHLSRLQETGWPKKIVSLPRKPLRLAATAVSTLGDLWPALPRRLPGVLRAESFEARFKPLIWNASRQRALLVAADAAPAEPPA
ncbi:MAG: NAD-dependent epimerase/dehydratase family protein [Pseudomonadota bacterium]